MKDDYDDDYSHFIEQYLACAISYNGIIKYGLLEKFLEKYKQTLEETLAQIDGFKILFRTNLKLITSTNHNVEIPPGLDSAKLNKIYEKSDFDWTDQKKFWKFKEWYMQNINEPYVENLV